MTQSVQIPTQSEPDFYLQVEDFILNASTNSELDNATENEIRLFLLTLLNHYKQQDLE